MFEYASPTDESASPHALHTQQGHHGHQAALEDGLDFINTLDTDRGAVVDRIETAEAALKWLFDHNLMHRDALARLEKTAAESPPVASRIANRVRRVRDAMRELVEATVDRRPPRSEQLAEVNRALKTHYIYELVPAPDGVSMDHRHEGDPVEGALARLAESLARELSQGQPERLRICANDTCDWVFADTSRTGKRKWCDMSTCGNRAKAARHRERQKAHDEGLASP